MESSQSNINYFAQADYRGKKTPFGIKAEDRSRHVYIIGKTGMGKSTLIENMAIQDIKNGEGMAIIDPHGKTADLLLDFVPQDRINDVVYFAPFDLEHPMAFNVLEDVEPDRRHLVVAGLMATFKKIWEDAWSARMEYILGNTLAALLEYPGATLLGVNRMLSDKVYRKKIVDNVTDPSVKSFWVTEFANYTERMAAEAVPAIQNKVGQFTSNGLIRNLIGQSKSTVDFREIMDKKKILIINLSKGLLGEDNAKLIGGMLITKIYLAAMSRANVTEATLRNLPAFYFYVDEFQTFVNDSFADILSEARKYKLSLTIAHQYVEQMPENVRNAVFGNVGTTIAFRVGPLDAELLEKVFMPQFTAEDLVNLGKYQMYLTLMIDGVGSPPFSATTLPPIISLGDSYREQIISESRRVYSVKRATVESDILKWHDEGKPVVVPKQPTQAAAPTSSNPTPPKVQAAPAPRPTPSSAPARPAALSQHNVAPLGVASLSALKSNIKDTGKHKDDLRAALAGLAGSNVAKKEEPKSEPKPAPIPAPVFAAKKEEPTSSPKEVPEDVLRKMLEV